jgi:hypothetical protein
VSPDALTRRRLLELGVAAAGAGALGPLAAPAGASAVDPHRFASAAQLRRWHRQLDALGLRATGTRPHEHYVDLLHERLARAGVKELRFERVPFRRWTTGSWRLELLGTGSPERIRTASYIPYTGHTPASGVSGQLALLGSASVAGKVAIFDAPSDPIPYTAFQAISYDVYDPRGYFSEPGAAYDRPWLGVSQIVQLLEQADREGAVAAIGVLDLPADSAHGAYYPYTGTIFGVPGVYVDRTVGARLKQLAAAGASARVTVPSKVVKTSSRNLMGVIPGASRELIVLHSHTDGTNGIEDNGPDAIVAASQYLARLPRRRLPRTILVLLTTGHFIGGKGARAFLERHEHDLVRRSAAAVTLEHLGAREWNAGAGDRTRLTGRFEPGVFFAPETSPLVNRSSAALKRSRSIPSSVLHPFVPAPESLDGNGWPAEGTSLWTQGHIPTTNFIAGPTYLLNWGIPTVDKFDAALARRQAISFTQLLLELSRVPRSRLRRLDLLKR